jgi:hypothetical protein
MGGRLNAVLRYCSGAAKNVEQIQEIDRYHERDWVGRDQVFYYKVLAVINLRKAGIL